MTSEQITAVREHAAHIVRELGMAIHHSEEAFDERADANASVQQIIEDLNAACNAATSLCAHASTLEEALEQMLFATEEEEKAAYTTAASPAPSAWKKRGKKHRSAKKGGRT